jgi:hypothetical protein
MEAAGFSERSVGLYQVTRGRAPENSSRKSPLSEPQLLDRYDNFRFVYLYVLTLQVICTFWKTVLRVILFFSQILELFNLEATVFPVASFVLPIQPGVTMEARFFRGVRRIAKRDY